MKKQLGIVTGILTVLGISSSLAGVPTLPRNDHGELIPFTHYEELSEHQKKEFGAFMLFYDLVSSKKIGGDTGLCVSYEPGGQGRADKISIGLDSNSYPTGVAKLTDLDATKLRNLKSLLKQIGQYIDSGCSADKAECRNSRSVNVTGFADAQHYGGASIQTAKSVAERNRLIERSIQENIKLSTARAKVFSEIVKGENFIPTDKIRVEGKASPIGEYLQNGLPVPKKYLDLDRSGEKLTSKDIKTNCPERRLTVIDVMFNGQSSQVKVGASTVTPVLKSASRKFVQRNNKSISLQSFKAFDQLKRAGKISSYTTDQEVDSIIEKVLENAGVKNQKIVNSCKNLATRTIIQEHLNKLSKLSPSSKQVILEQSELNILKKSESNSRYRDGNNELYSHLNKLSDGFGGIQTVVGNKKLASIVGANAGQSTSFNDCFSATSAMQMEFGDENKSNGVKENSLCQPVSANNKGEINIKFDPEQMHDHKVLHIGCQACQTGFRYVSQQYKNPETGKLETQMLPIYIDRELSGTSYINKEDPSQFSKRPISKAEAEELAEKFNKYKKLANQNYNELLNTSNNLRNSKEANQKIDLKNRRIFYSQVKGFYANNASPRNMSFCLDNKAISQCPSNRLFKPFDEKLSSDEKRSEFLKLTGISEEEFSTLERSFEILHKKNFGDVQKDYLLGKISGKENTDLSFRYENVILKGIETRDVMTNWTGGTSTSDNAALFGALKKPRYYLLDDCDCSSEDLISEAQARGKSLALDRIPSSLSKQKVGQRACLVSMPVPPSCMVNPNEKGAKDEGEKSEGSIRWMGANGELMDKAISEMMQHLLTENSKVALPGCEGLQPMEAAEKIVQSAECSGVMSLPQGEGLDCKK